MKRAAAALALLALTACHQAPSALPAPPPSSSLTARPAKSLALLPKAGIYAVATADRGAWRVDLHLGDAEETRAFEARSAEGIAVTVTPRKQGPVASWTVPPDRFLNGQPFLVTLKTTGGEIPLRLEVPALQAGQAMAGLRVIVLK